MYTPSFLVLLFFTQNYIFCHLKNDVFKNTLHPSRTVQMFSVVISYYKYYLIGQKIRQKIQILCKERTTFASRNTVTTSRSFIFYLFKRISGYLNEYEVVKVLRDAKMCSILVSDIQKILAHRGPQMIYMIYDIDCE